MISCAEKGLAPIWYLLSRWIATHRRLFTAAAADDVLWMPVPRETTTCPHVLSLQAFKVGNLPWN